MYIQCTCTCTTYGHYAHDLIGNTCVCLDSIVVCCFENVANMYISRRAEPDMQQKQPDEAESDRARSSTKDCRCINLSKHAIVHCAYIDIHVCSVQFAQSRDYVAHSQNPEIAHYSYVILRLCNTLARSRDCTTIVRNLLLRRACAETILWMREKLLKNGDFVSVL